MKPENLLIALAAAVVAAVCVNCQHTQQYKVIKEISDLQETEQLDRVDLSSLDLRDCGELFSGKTAFGDKGVRQWTDRVVWPEASKMPEGFDPQRLLEESKKPEGVAGLHAKGNYRQGSQNRHHRPAAVQGTSGVQRPDKAL